MAVEVAITTTVGDYPGPFPSEWIIHANLAMLVHAWLALLADALLLLKLSLHPGIINSLIKG